MSLNDYLTKNGVEASEGHIYQVQEQCDIINQRIDWSKVKTVLEIGFNAGHSADFFLSRHTGISVVSFEISQNKHTLMGKEYIDKVYPGRHEIVWGDSTITIPRFETRKFDVIFIDGGHHLDVARLDIANCVRFAHADTVVIIDDVVYDHAWVAEYTFGPTRAWREFINISVVEETFHRDFSDGRGMSFGRYKISCDYVVKKPIVVDAFMFYNELDMLKYRLTVMGPYVDRFVICECPVSFAGKPKPLYFLENKHLFEPWLDKITHLVWTGHVSDVHTLDDSWFNENNQRNHLLEGMRDLKSNDVVIISDVDEIVDPIVLEKIDYILGRLPTVKLSMDMYYYNMKHKCTSQWNFARAARYKFVRDVKPHFCRNTKREDPVVKNAGWHLSYFGDEKFIINKTKNFAHLEAGNLFEDDDIDKIRDIVDRGVDVYSRSELYFTKANNERLPPHLDILPHQELN
jgi:beta-1,4-mannosyl-glycoprotein beta-1,4-N-acetylglucosaminyltransferase